MAYCPACSLPGKPLEHGVEGCPRQPRERPVPCRGASLRESMAGRHFTNALDRICERCRARMGEQVTA